MQSNNIFKLFLDIFSSYGIMFLRMSIYFVSLPIYINIYGKDLYGMYLLIFGLANSFMFLDFGISNSIIKYATSFKRSRDYNKFSKEISYCLSAVFYTIFLISILFVTTGVFYESLFKIESENSLTAKYLFFMAIPLTISIIILNFTKFFLNGLGHFYKRNLVQIFTILLNIVIVAGVYIFEFNILILAALIIIPHIFGIFVDIIFLTKNEPKLVKILKIRPSLKWNFIFKSEYANFNLNIFKNSIISFFSKEFDKPLIAIFLGANFLIDYSIMMYPYNFLKSIIANIFFVVQQKLQINLDNKIRLKNMISTFNKFNIIFLVLLLFLTLNIYPNFVNLWIPDHEYIAASSWAAIAILNLLISGLYKCQFALLLFSKNNKEIVRLSIISIFLNVIISTILIKHLGVLAVLIGTTFQAIYSFIYFYYKNSKVIHIRLKDYIDTRIIVYVIILILSFFYFQNIQFFIQDVWINFIVRIVIASLPLISFIIFFFKNEYYKLKLI